MARQSLSRILMASKSTTSACSPTTIRAARERAGLTQSEAGALIGVDRVSWGRYEAGVRSLRPHEWAYWLHVAGIKRMAFKARP